MFLSRMLLGLLLTISFVQTLQAAPFMVKFGFINERPDEPDHVLKINGSFVQYLNQKLAQHQSSAEIVIAKNLDDMVQKIQRGDINVVGESLFATFKLTDQAQMQPLVLAWRKGVRSYETLFVVRQDSAIQKLADLVGKTIVFESPRSTSAYAVPKAFLLSKNMKVMPASQNNLPPDTIKYIFSGDESTQAYQVALKKADAAAFNTTDWEETQAAVKKQLRIIERTPPMLRWLISTHVSVPTNVQQVLKEILLAMANDSAAELAIKQSKMLKFELLSPEDEQHVQQIRTLLKFNEAQ